MKRSLASTIALFAACLPTAFADEGKLTIQPGEFIVSETFDATVLPSASVSIGIASKSWSAFEITHMTEHGAQVKKGDILLAFDADGIGVAIEDLKKAVDRREHEIAAARLELTQLRETAEERVAASRRAAEEAAEHYQYHTETRLAVDVEIAKQAVVRAEQRLRNANEELVQLKRMYEADDLVEETEEIILSRAMEAVEAAEFGLSVERLEQTRRVEIMIPRETESLLEKKKETARKFASDEQEIPLTLALKEADLTRLEALQKRDQENLAKLEADRELLEIPAPADGLFYHGVIEKGGWQTPADLMRTLVVSGNPPVKRPIATFIPADAKLALHAMLSEASARSFADDSATGLATLKGRGDVSIPVSIGRIAPVPTPEKLHHAVLDADWPDGIAPAPGASAEIRIISYARDAAIHVPTKAISFGISGWEVEVKLADGKTQKRSVIRGRVSGDQVEILQGLEAGQVIVLP